MEAKITSLTRLQSGCAVTVTLSNDTDCQEALHFLLSPEDEVVLSGLQKGALLDEDTLSILSRYHDRYHAYRRALAILEAGDNSAQALYRKLHRRGINSEAAGYAVTRVRESGFLDEDRQLRRMILRLAEEKLWGMSRITAYLADKGYTAASVRRIAEELVQAEELDFSDIKKRLFRREAPKTRAEWQKCLYKHGFSYSDS